MNRDDVALTEQRFQGVRAANADCQLRTAGLVRVEEHHVHVEGLGAQRSRGADTTQPDHAERAIRKTLTKGIQCWPPITARIGTQIYIVKGNALGERQHQCHGVIRDFTRAVVRRVAHGNAQVAPGLQIHLVKTDGRLHVNAALVELREVLQWHRRPNHTIAIAPLLVRHLSEIAHKRRFNIGAEQAAFYVESIGPADLGPE